MPKKPEELQLYELRLGLGSRSRYALDTHLAVNASSPGTMDEARELADAVRDMVNAGMGQTYEVQFLKCIGVTYVWK